MNNMPAERNRRVLVIDDNRAIHDDFRKILCPATATAAALDATEAALFGLPTTAIPQNQFEIDSAYQGQEGVLLAAKALEAGRPYAMAFVDVRMPPGWDGVETTGKLWELDPNLQVVLCTAYSDYSWREMFEKLGQRDGLLILKKPFDAVEAFQLAHALTEKWWLHQQSRRKMEELESMVAERTAELARSETLYHSLVENVPQHIFRKDRAGRFTFGNSLFCLGLGKPLAGILGRTDQDFFPSPHAAKYHQDDQRVLATGQPFEGDEENRQADGKTNFVHVVKTPLRDAAGQIIGIQGISWDITERRQAEQTLRESEDRYRLLVEESPDAIGIYQDGKLVFVNSTGIHVMGAKTQAELLGRRSEQIIHPDDLTLATDRIRRRLAGETGVYPAEVRYLRLDGTTVSLEVSAAPITLNGRPAMQFIGRDITERKRAEEALRESEERFSSAFEHAPIGVALVSPEGCWLKVNQALCDVVGYSEAELLASTFQDITHPEDLAGDLENVRRLIAGEIRSYQMEKRYLHKHGHLVTVLLDVSLVRDDQGQPRYFISQIQDISARKQAENALRESDEKFRQLADNITDAFWIRSPDLRKVHYISPAFERIWGRSVASLYANPQAWADFILPEDRERVLAAFAALTGDAPSLDIEYRIVRPDGEIGWVRVRGFQVRDAANNLIRHTGIVTDITERKQTEDTLRRTEELYRRAIAGAGAVPYASDYQTRSYVFIGEGIESLIGYSSPEVTGQLWKQIIQESIMTGETAGLSKEEAVRRMAGGEIQNWRCDMRVRTRDGKLRWLSDASVQHLDAAGRPIGSMGILQDITERKRNEISALAFSKLGQRLSSAASAREAFGVVGEVSKELFGWDAFCINLYRADNDLMHSGFAIDTIDGQPVAEERDQPERPGELYRRIIERGGELILRELPGSEVPHLVPFGDVSRPSAALMFVPIRSHGGVVGILSIQSYTPNAYHQQDLKTLQTMADQCGGAFERIWAEEALRKSEAQLFQSQKLETVGKLAGGVAHEFNSILTAIIGQSELILGDLPPGHPLSQNAAEISQAAGRAATLTRQLLAYGRRTFLRPESLDLNQVVAGMEVTVRHLVGGAVDVRIVPAAGLHVVKADAGQIEQVILNLVMNATEAMPNGGNLTLETANVSLDHELVRRYPDLKPGEYVMLAITDTGAGMSEAVKARAFEPFFTTKRVGQGTGLGLSTCYGIVKQSGGHLSVYSELGRGTTFKIYLPQVAAQTTHPIPRLNAPDLPCGTETILLVEDDPALREMAAKLLRRLGYTVFAAANGVEALSLQHERSTGHVDLLFTDVVMPHMSGRELADRVRALFPQTRILFTSAYTENAAVHQGVLNRGVALLQKPFTPSALANKLREVLDQPGAPT